VRIRAARTLRHGVFEDTNGVFATAVKDPSERGFIAASNALAATVL
jgi:hypothetical protein